MTKGGEIMAVNVTSRTGNVKNKRSHALNATKTRQNLNLQVVRLDDGSKVRMSTKEKRTLLKNQKAA
jgi:ribosomal protein L28